MDAGFSLKTENPIQKANIFSRLFFCWLLPIIKKGSKQDLSVSDLYKLKDKDKSKNLTDAFEKNWNEEIARAKAKNCKPSLLKVILKTFTCELIIYGLNWFYTYGILLSSRPLILNKLIGMFTDKNKVVKSSDMYICSSMLVIVSLLTAFGLHHGCFALQTTAMRIRVALSSLIYRKITRLNQKALGEITTGQVVNLLSNDLIRFDLVMPCIHVLWSMPFQITILFAICWNQVGISSVVGFLTILLLTVPVQGLLISFVGSLRVSISKKSDYRAKLMSEIVTGMQVIKMYAWEKPFEKLIEVARATEIKYITRSSYLKGVYTGCMLFTQRVALCTTLICFVLLGNSLSADKVFSLSQTYSTLQLVMAVMFSTTLGLAAEAWVSIKRVQQFLCLEEREVTVEETKNPNVFLVNVSASWLSTGRTLESINLEVSPGTLCAVVGAVGSGKSSLLQLLLGELPVKTGIKEVAGKISYCSQEPWLFQSTVRQNILFGLEYERSWYKNVVKLCALERDFEQFTKGDRTIVGEKGVSLSGGQRARINLARAVYRNADIYLLDDPLSAVDTHVGKHLFHECIYNHLRGKTRILVTHQLQYLKKADLIIVLKDGRIDSHGTFEELSKEGSDFTKLLVDPCDGEKEVEFCKPEVSDLTASTLSKQSIIASMEKLYFKNGEEEEEIGSQPNAKPFKNYILATKNFPIVFVFFFLILILQCFLICVDGWVAFWTLQEEIRQSNDSNIHIPSLITDQDNYSSIINPTISNISIKYNNFDYIFDELYINGSLTKIFKTSVCMYCYCGFVLGFIIVTFLCVYFLFKICMMSSVNLHSQIFHKLLKAPMRFFDINSSGRILNRFTKDMGAIDEILPKTLLDVIQILIVIIGILINITVSNPYMIVAIIIVGTIFFKCKYYYMLSAKALKHLEGKTKSPVFSHITSTMNGLATIRALKAEAILIDEFDEHQDVHSSAWYLSIACMNFFSLMLDTMCVAFLACVTYGFVILNGFSRVNGSVVGLGISQCMILTGMLQYGMRQAAEAVNYSTSIERVLHYTSLDNEGPFETLKGNNPKGTWPKRGLIQFKNLSMSYVEAGAPVLKCLNFVLKPGEKIGIVGRTGAGKSSLISALFRLTPLEGSIFIDGVDTKQLGLTDLRKKISIIPQEPLLFSDTIRYNLDPFNEFDDDKIWDTLEQVELKDSIESLDILVTEGGGNFSLGQRQLVCLARAILKNNKILILDEATANVDHKTDALIQTTIRNIFKDCTVLTIAHRLNTIMDSDRVLVMSFGNMVEFDHPQKLLQNPDGYFHNLVLETGLTMSAELKNIAKLTYENKQN